MLLVDELQARRVAATMSKIVRSLPLDDFTDPRFYPPRDADKDLVAQYFLVMVAIDHRLSRPGRPYEGLVDGEKYHGADLLYALGARRLREDPGFFDAHSLAGLTAEDVRRWLRSDDGAEPPDPEVRAALLRDLGRRLLEAYGGSALRLIEESGGRLRWHPEPRRGLLDHLRAFLAFNDPVEKKSHLFAKFIERRGLFRASDPWNKHVPVDNHLVRLAVRTRIVKPVGGAQQWFTRSAPHLDPETDVYIRMVVRRAWDLVARAARLDPYVLDDLLWSMGRKCCTRDAPACTAGCKPGCEKLGLCRGAVCLLREVCAPRPIDIVEHAFIDTWWY